MADTTRGVPLKDKLFQVFLTGANFKNISPVDIAESITSTPGILHGIVVKNNSYAIAYFYQEKERNNFLNSETLVIQKDNEQIKCKIQLKLKMKFYFIKGVPINYTPSQIKDQLKMKLGTLKVLLIRTAKAKIFTGAIKISALEDSSIPNFTTIFGKNLKIVNEEKLKEDSQKEKIENKQVVENENENENEKDNNDASEQNEESFNQEKSDEYFNVNSKS